MISRCPSLSVASVHSVVDALCPRSPHDLRRGLSGKHTRRRQRIHGRGVDDPVDLDALERAV